MASLIVLLPMGVGACVGACIGALSTLLPLRWHVYASVLLGTPAVALTMWLCISTRIRRALLRLVGIRFDPNAPRDPLDGILLVAVAGTSLACVVAQQVAYATVYLSNAMLRWQVRHWVLN